MAHELVDVIAMARSAWGYSQVLDNQARETPGNAHRFLAQRDALRRECGRWIAQVKRLHVEQRINEPWHEWAPKAFGWSYAIIKRRIRDAAYPDPAERREAAQQERGGDAKIMQQHSAIAAAWNAGSDEVRMRFLQDAITWLSPKRFVEFARFFDFEREGRHYTR